MGYSYYSEGGEKIKTIAVIALIVALVASIVAIVLMSLGIWGSTDDGSIGVNVTTGKCKIDIVDAEGVSIVGDVLDFAIEDGVDTLYFEPGMTCYTEAFRVKNIGTVGINFHVSVSEDDSIDSEEFKQAFELWITNDLTDIYAAKELTEFTGTLMPDGQSGEYYLVVRMKDTAGNDFQDKTYTGIGITVHAVQITESNEE